MTSVPEGDQQAAAPADETSAASSHRASRAQELKTYGRHMLRNLVLVLIGVVVVVIVAYTLAAFVPRSWAQWIGQRVDGSLTTGTLWGLLLGFTCTFLPLLVAAQTFVRPWIKGWWKLVVVLVAFVLALPNVMTLAIVLGSGSGAHAGERILDVEAPGFRAASLWGAIIGALLFVLLAWVIGSNRRRGRRVKDLEAEAAARKTADAEKG